MERQDFSVRRERAFLVGCYPSGKFSGDEEPLDELEELSRTAGAIVAGKVVQRLNRPHPTYYVGSGKAEEIKRLTSEFDVDVIIFDNDLTPAQVRNLERLTQRKVVDRSELILDIFATHARTTQAKLQVELAQLEYILPRLRRMWTHLSRFEGGIGVRGPGEKQLEEDRRAVVHRIHDLRRKLAHIQNRREREVRRRSEEFTASLVGYTNAGKSTVMNLLTNANAIVEDKLFATLDTRTRLWQLDKYRRVLLSDTVGFIRDLPHHLVASFHATLEEVNRADLLLHIVDASHPKCEVQMEVVQGVLEQIGAGDKQVLLVFNKIDKISDEEVKYLKKSYPGSAVISALQGTNIDELRHRVLEVVRGSEVAVELTAPLSNGHLISRFREIAQTVHEELRGQHIVLRGHIQRRFVSELSRLNGGGVRVIQ